MLLLEWMVTVVVKVHDGGRGWVMLLLLMLEGELRAPRHVRRVVDVVSVGVIGALIKVASNLNTESPEVFGDVALLKI